ncbi:MULTISPECIES: DUF817 domain-containing protein [Streptomyces]|uniref:DUF817 domain-containing protein n=1 Tax=Streptomyces tricolor TaxID=68277 RepID=A0ABS9JTH2_9ACTN|nr:DUF817 domain-containing protein [Streptomyces tricolor]MCG0068868.1 DUF817 domain-containing protein [Streptomyces tricolor]MYU30910.1 DUF817 family protein [Streptomyces sp. SID7810]CUW32002.1 hypothetical protein TUE45_06751 [Streptomyces reticuli]
MRHEKRSLASGLRHGCAQLVRFGVVQARACAFAVALLAGIGASRLLPPLPVARYDLVLVYGVLLTLLARRVGWETRRDTAVIAVCHVIGLLFELIKVRMGSWSYPEDALTKIGGVPLYGGFMYAAVASYVCRARRLMRLRYTRYRAAATTLVAAAVYLNFFTHHWIPDLRWPLAVAMIAATAGTWVGFSVGAHRYRMPLAVSFVLIGFFLWVAENAATYAGAWSYPQQLGGWQPVPLTKFGAWSLLISVTFVLVEHLGATGPKRRTGRPGTDGCPPPAPPVSDSFKTG